MLLRLKRPAGKVGTPVDYDFWSLHRGRRTIVSMNVAGRRSLYESAVKEGICSVISRHRLCTGPRAHVAVASHKNREPEHKNGLWGSYRDYMESC